MKYSLFVPLIVIFASAPAAWAQETPVPDTLEWRRYFPLEVGNQWQYREDAYGEIRYFRWHVSADTVVEGQPYFVIDASGYDVGRDLLASGEWLVRYDNVHANLLVRSQWADGTYFDDWLQEIPCGLDADFDAYHECTGIRTGMSYWVYGDRNETFFVGGDAVRPEVAKWFSGLGGDIILLSDIGLVWQRVEGGSPIMELVYAHVGESTFGDAVVSTSRETPDRNEPFARRMYAFPNPFTHSTTIVYSNATPEPAEFEVFDLLGRRVHHVTDAASLTGDGRFTLEGSHLPAGTYFVRAAGARSSTTLSIRLIK